MAQDCLFFELKFLKLIWLQNLLDRCNILISWLRMLESKGIRTVHPDLPCSEQCGEDYGIGQPFLLDDKGSENEET